MKYEQESPFAVQIELAEGCNLRCTFCGLNGIREPKAHNFKFMTKETLQSAVAQMVAANWNPRIEFAMHGEPSMHPDPAGMFAAVREIAPKYHIMMTSNGGGFMAKPGPEERVLELFRAGLNVLALDDYDGVKFVDRIRKAVFGVDRNVEIDTYTRLLDDGKPLTGYEYPQNRNGNPHGRGPATRKQITFIQDISQARKGNHSHLGNHAGAAAPPLTEPMHARCAKPFREMSIRWDGSVAICCNDWRGTFKCGNVVTDGLLEVWHNPALNAARKRLQAYDRNFGPCKGCNHTTYRNGLLPDKMGKVKLPEATKADDKLIAAALAGASYTAPVLRPWETK